MGGKGKLYNRKRKHPVEDEEEEQQSDDQEIEEFNLPTKHQLKSLYHEARERRLIIILDGAQLETVKVGRSFELLNCDDHMNILRKYNRDLSTCRPDITHQCLMMLFDSPLNRAGLLQVYLHTQRNVLIEINPQTRIPRTFKRFAGLMVQLLHKFMIRADENSTLLMKVIKNPITNHLPAGCKKYAMSFTGRLISHPRELVPPLRLDNGDENDEPIAIVIGAFAHGVLNTNYTEELISISNCPLSAALTCTKLCSAFEEVWGVL